MQERAFSNDKIKFVWNAAIEEVLGDPAIVVVREVTKTFEERLEDRASALVEHFTRKTPKGEFVVLIPSRK